MLYTILFIVLIIIIVYYFNNYNFLKSLDETYVAKSNWEFQLLIFKFAVASIFNKLKYNKEDGAMKEEEYDKATLYAILYNMYDKLGIVKNDKGKDFQFTFNTWGFYLPDKTGITKDEPQFAGMTAYSNYFKYPELASYMENNKPTIVELGCGTGAGAYHICNNYDCKYIAIDMQKAAIETLNKIHKHDNLEGRWKNAQKTEIESNSVDIVIINETHISEMVGVMTDEDKKVFDELIRILKPGGYFCWGNVIPDATWKPCMKYLATKLSLLNSVDYTKEAILARDLDKERVELYISSIRKHLWLSKIPGSSSFIDKIMLLLKNFYRDPGTDLYNEMVNGRDTYKQHIYKKV
uniref:Methyltransferase domain protein n=1 Tax=Megaviridae environmental sample TaxID=1737588 RepID=A0A5J6VLV1_9VIRU|nr:MAG: methyltransferase domain protein [Megaviridae environmental sample]